MLATVGLILRNLSTVGRAVIHMRTKDLAPFYKSLKHWRPCEALQYVN
jgi:hypothetical protein